MAKLPFILRADGKSTSERRFIGGHSRSPDLCPCGCQNVIVWHAMNWKQRRKARKKYNVT